jgi:hypothetical protein
MKSILVTAGYGGNTNQPFVQVEGEAIDGPIQLSPQEARAFAMTLLESADAAESDGFIVEFMRKELKADHEHTMVLLKEFRKFRQNARGQL